MYYVLQCTTLFTTHYSVSSTTLKTRYILLPYIVLRFITTTTCICLLMFNCISLLQYAYFFVPHVGDGMSLYIIISVCFNCLMFLNVRNSCQLFFNSSEPAPYFTHASFITSTFNVVLAFTFHSTEL